MIKNYNCNEIKYLDVPNVIGLDKKDAQKILKNFKIIYSGSGNIVKEQSPEAHSRIKEGEEIRLLLGD